jgi:long-chain acyl-CoA synthetase
VTPPLFLTSTDDPDATVTVVRSSHTGVCVVLPHEWTRQQHNNVLSALNFAQQQSRLREGDLVLFGSGSTGNPRGIIRTWASWEASLSPLSELTGASAADVIAIPGSLSSTMNLYAYVHAAHIGASIVNTWSDNVTLAHVVAPAVDRVLDRVASGELPRLRMLITAGDRLPDAVHARAHDLRLQVGEYYGAAELSFVGWRTSAGPFIDFPGVATKLHDNELWVSSKYIARESLSDPGSWRHEGVWHTVGDAAQIHASGGWFIRGRGSQAITTAGHTVLVEEVERDLRAIPSIDDCAVAGKQHTTLGNILIAVVETDAEESALKRAVSTWPGATRPRRWLRVDRLPRTAGGKIDRAAVQRIIEEQT